MAYAGPLCLVRLLSAIGKNKNVNNSSEKSSNASINWAKLGSSKLIPKGVILQEEGMRISKSFYVKKGLLRSYTIDDNGKIHIFMFAPEGWIVSDIPSYIYSTPTELFVDAIEDSEIVELEMTNISLDIIGVEDSKIHAEVSKLLRRIVVLQKRVIMLMSATARERYEHFIETYPQLINRVPLKMIASYLGITPEALSSIRRKIRNNKT